MCRVGTTCTSQCLRHAAGARAAAPGVRTGRAKTGAARAGLPAQAGAPSAAACSTVACMHAPPSHAALGRDPTCNLRGEYTDMSESALQVAHAYLQAESTPAGRLDDGTAVAQVLLVCINIHALCPGYRTCLHPSCPRGSYIRSSGSCHVHNCNPHSDRDACIYGSARVAGRCVRLAACIMLLRMHMQIVTQSKATARLLT